MCFVKSKSKDDSPSKAQKLARSPSIPASNDENATGKRPGRMSRSQTRRFLYFHNKTLSKIKLL